MITNELKKFKVAVEVPCSYCDGSGEVYKGEFDNAYQVECETCGGIGHMTIKMPLHHLKNILDGGEL